MCYKLEVNVKKIVYTAAILCVASLVFAGCGKGTNGDKKDNINNENGNENSTGNSTENNSSEKNEALVASGEETVEAADVVDENMVPVYGSSIKDGTYDINVDSSSSMFNVTKCSLTVKNGNMTAVMTMKGTGYLKVFMGVGNDAVNAEEAAFIPYVENEDGEHTFTVPVEALDKGLDCCAFSKNKKKWYDRILVFRADSLPTEAFIDGMIKSVETLNLKDGEYTVEVKLSGGSGKTSVESPAKIKIANGTATATIVFSSKNYDYVKINDVKYDKINSEGNSTFEIPVEGFDFNMPVIADTTAMSTPHEIEYTLYFDSATLK